MSPVASPSPAFRPGARLALGAPAIAMAATFLAFGAVVREAGLGPGWALAASWAIYGMPGQLVLLAAATGGATGGMAAAVLGALAVNARFLPMAIALGGLLRRREGGAGAAFRMAPAVPFIAITPWAAAMRHLPGLPQPERLPWFLGFGLTSWLVAGAAAVTGHQVAGLLGPAARAALTVANPLYFALLLALDLDRPASRRAILAGVAAAPLALVLPPAWGLLGAGLAGGSVAFWLGRRRGGG